ncbi:MAG: glycosyltransferase family 39 protein [Quinella sp. 1Q5]|nr:glycosyltransferase family 39 protein [Quinella sp. 1Q5]
MEKVLSLCQLIIYFLPIVAYFKSNRFRRKVDNAEKFLGKLHTGAFLLFCFAFMFFVAIFLLHTGSNWGGDFSLYIAQARAILTGEIDPWLEKQSFIIAHSSPGFSPLMYPWGTSLLILPVYSLFGLNLYAFKLISVFCMAAAWITLFLLLRMKENSVTAIVLVAVMMFNANYIFFIDNVLSEFPYLFLSMLAIFFVYKRALTKNFKLYGVLAGAAIFFAANTRALGIALLLALIVEDFLSVVKNFSVKKILPHTVPYITYGLLSAIFSLCLPQIAIQDNVGYLASFSFKPTDILGQMIYYMHTFGTLFLVDLKSMYFIDPDNVLYPLTGIFIVALSIFGAVKNFSESRFIVFYVAITFAIIFVFHERPGLRYVFAIVPFVVYFMFKAVGSFRFPKLRKLLAVSVVSVSLLFSACMIIFLQASGWNSNQAYTADAVATYEFIKQNVSDDKVVFFFKPRVLYLNTNVYSYFLWEDSEESLQSADYVLLTESDYYPKLAAMLKDNKKYSHIYGNKTFDLYRIIK